MKVFRVNPGANGYAGKGGYEAVLMSGMNLEDAENFEALSSLLGHTEDMAVAA